MSKGHSVDTFGNTVLGIIIGISLLWILFYGEPDVIDAIRAIFLKWAGL